MRYGFVIDQNRCIGCHACTVACKEEHNIRVGVNRTWVKYIEKGRIQTPAVTLPCSAATTATTRRASKSAPPWRCFADPTVSSTSITSVASVVNPVCRHARTMRCTSIPTATRRPSATLTHHASRWATNRPAKSSVRPKRFFPAISGRSH